MVERSKFTHSICDECWYAIKSFEPFRMNSQYRVEETCCFCGRLTKSGIYFREEPSNLPCEGKHDTKNESSKKD